MYTKKFIKLSGIYLLVELLELSFSLHNISNGKTNESMVKIGTVVYTIQDLCISNRNIVMQSLILSIIQIP